MHRTAKQVTLDELVVMREERTSLIDRVNVVLAELKLKGGEIEEYELYVSAVSGIVLDVQDVQSTWSSITGWIMSGEGGIRVAKNIGRGLGMLIAFALLAWLVGIVVSFVLSFLSFVSELQRILSNAASAGSSC